MSTIRTTGEFCVTVAGTIRLTEQAYKEVAAQMEETIRFNAEWADAMLTVLESGAAERGDPLVVY